MNNYKIKVNSEAESKEAQELFFELGYGFEGNKIREVQNLEYFGSFYLFAYGDDYDLTHSSDRELFIWKQHKEITLPELRDMVKPKMKEYLDSKRNYEFVLSTEKEEGFIEIPEVAEFAVLNGDNEINFYTGIGLEKNHFIPDAIIWQRPTQPEALPFIDDEPRKSSFMTPEQQSRFAERAEKVVEPLVKLSKGLNIHDPESPNDQYAEIEQVRQDVVNHPNHYTQGKVDCIDALEAATVGKAGIEAVCVANVIKYLWRYEEKNGKEDIKKAQWYLNKLLDSID